jgi:hypothetical protein
MKDIFKDLPRFIKPRISRYLFGVAALSAVSVGAIDSVSVGSDHKLATSYAQLIRVDTRFGTNQEIPPSNLTGTWEDFDFDSFRPSGFVRLGFMVNTSGIYRLDIGPEENGSRIVFGNRLVKVDNTDIRYPSEPPTIYPAVSQFSKEELVQSTLK